eukprot:gnl/MRDRNA2_/MRDRNA2_208911_c0_seq1.p1 gnl/MRDRNA2_/MRDRNA2_208911_c0~~gnl/MRDRNA2_/MRDRNA2_208911_c0_seq1.p1  ORF type:complete len:247 (+),score=43.82 gnl/MRDRNA2_/MRDRNA2_208911_c0_seq1:84-743(+)
MLAVFDPSDLTGGGGGGLATNEARSAVHSALMDTLPKLSDLRLRVYARALQELCMPSRAVPEEHRAWHVAAASMAVNATIAALPARLPYESAEQLEDFERSPFLTRAQKNNLLKLLVPLRLDEKSALINPTAESWTLGQGTPAEDWALYGLHHQQQQFNWDAFDEWPYRTWDPRLQRLFADPTADLQVGLPIDMPRVPSLDTAAHRFKQMVAAIEATYY